MENITIINNTETAIFEENVKKIKLAGLQLDGIKEKRLPYQNDIYEEKEPEFEEKAEPIFVPPVNSFESEKEFEPEEKTFEMPSLEKPYSGIKEQEIVNFKNIEAIKDLGNTYKGTVKQAPKKEEKPKEEKAKKEDISLEDFNKELEKESFLPKTELRKAELGNKLKTLKDKISEKEDLIAKTREEYANEGTRAEAIAQKEADLHEVLDGINAWNMGFFTKFKEEQIVKDCLKYIENVYGVFRGDYEEQLRLAAECKNKKESLANKEKENRVDLKQTKEELNAFVQKEYFGLKELNIQDHKAKEANEEVTKITGISDESVRSLEEPKFEEINPINTFDSLREPQFESKRVLDIKSYESPEEEYSFKRAI